MITKFLKITTFFLTSILLLVGALFIGINVKAEPDEPTSYSSNYSQEKA